MGELAVELHPGAQSGMDARGCRGGHTRKIHQTSHSPIWWQPLTIPLRHVSAKKQGISRIFHLRSVWVCPLQGLAIGAPTPRPARAFGIAPRSRADKIR